MTPLLTILATALIGFSAYPHGEDKPGPHGGHIKMPANFHTELVLENDGSFRVYLLDIKFQNPTIENSSIKVKYIDGKKMQKVVCLPKSTDHFYCKPTKLIKNGVIAIDAVRNGTVAQMAAKYVLPLKSFKTNN